MLDRIAEETGTYIHRDSLRSEVLLFGSEQRKARARRHIDRELHSAELDIRKRLLSARGDSGVLRAP